MYISLHSLKSEEQKEAARIALRLYKENEHHNDHAENMFMLAELLGNEVSKHLTQYNLNFKKVKGYVNTDLNNITYKSIRGLYQELVRLAD